MSTDSEQLLHAGVSTAKETFERFTGELRCGADDIDKVFCHQVGVAHRRLLFETLDLRPQADFSTVEFLGNTGSVAVPVTAAIGIERDHLSPSDRVAMLGIGSGLNVVMLGVDWRTNSGRGNKPSDDSARQHAAVASST